MDSAARAAIDEEHEIMRARARVMADPNVPALRSALDLFRAAKAPVPVGTAYAAALAALLLKDEAAVRETLPAVLRAAPGPNQRWIKLLHTELLLSTPQLRGELKADASARLAGASAGSWPRPELVLLGRAVLSQPDLKPQNDLDLRELHQALRAWVVRHPQDGLIWQLLADVEAARGNRIAMLRATAEVHLAAGKPDHALLALQAARRNARPGLGDDAVELAVIDARLAELRRQRADNFQRQGRPDPNARDKRDDFADARDAEISAAQRVQPGSQEGQNPATLKK
jgi:predicted Zn-dependent protease